MLIRNSLPEGHSKERGKKANEETMYTLAMDHRYLGCGYDMVTTPKEGGPTLLIHNDRNQYYCKN